MNRIQCLVKGLALTLVFVGVGGISLAQEKPRKSQDGPRTSMIDELWRQMGQLQKQIVGLEVGDANPRATPRSEPLPGNIAQQLPDNVSQKKSDGKPRDAQKPVPASKTVPGPEKPPKLRDSTNEAQIDQLWRQITELQKAILKLEIADTNPHLLASATPAANGNGRTERPDTASTKNSDRTSGNGPNRETPQKTIPGQEKPLEPRGGSNEAQIGQLWQQISQLYKQIVALEVGDMGPRGY
jgi:hypothetical protein